MHRQFEHESPEIIHRFFMLSKEDIGKKNVKKKQMEQEWKVFVIYWI